MLLCAKDMMLNVARQGAIYACFKSRKQRFYSSRQNMKRRVSHPRRLALTIVGVFLVIIVALLGIGEFMLATSLRPTPSSYRQEVATLDTMRRLYPHIVPWLDSLQQHNALRDTTIEAPDGTKLHGYYIRAAQPTSRVALLVHGYQDAGLRMIHIAYLYHHDLHTNVLMPDHRYHGKTPGTSIGMGWNDRLDVRQWAWTVPEIFRLSPFVKDASLEKNTNSPANASVMPPKGVTNEAPRLVVHGISMGAATTMMLSGTDSVPPVRAYVEDCGYTSAWNIFASELEKRYHLPAFPVMHVTDVLCQLHYGWSFREADAEAAVRRCKRPMLFIHGGKDDFVPTRMVYDVYAAKSAPKALWVAPGSAHAMSYHDHAAEYTQRVRRFLAPYW